VNNISSVFLDMYSYCVSLAVCLRDYTKGGSDRVGLWDVRRVRQAGSSSQQRWGGVFHLQRQVSRLTRWSGWCKVQSLLLDITIYWSPSVVSDRAACHSGFLQYISL